MINGKKYLTFCHDYGINNKDGWEVTSIKIFPTLQKIKVKKL